MGSLWEFICGPHRRALPQKRVHQNQQSFTPKSVISCAHNFVNVEYFLYYCVFFLNQLSFSLLIYFSVRSPAQVGCMRQVLGPGALGSPRGIGWRGRWEGGSGWGMYVYPWLIRVYVWQKPLQYCKVISLQLIKKKYKKKKKTKNLLLCYLKHCYLHDWSSEVLVTYFQIHTN